MSIYYINLKVYFVHQKKKIYGYCMILNQGNDDGLTKIKDIKYEELLNKIAIFIEFTMCLIIYSFTLNLI